MKLGEVRAKIVKIEEELKQANEELLKTNDDLGVISFIYVFN